MALLKEHQTLIDKIFFKHFICEKLQAKFINRHFYFEAEEIIR